MYYIIVVSPQTHELRYAIRCQTAKDRAVVIAKHDKTLRPESDLWMFKAQVGHRYIRGLSGKWVKAKCYGIEVEIQKAKRHLKGVEGKDEQNQKATIQRRQEVQQEVQESRGMLVVSQRSAA